MNINEYSRVTVTSLPNTKELNLEKVINLYNSAISLLLKRDEDKEKRIRALENDVGRGKKISKDIVLITGNYTVSDFYNDKILISDSATDTVIQFPRSTGSKNMIIVKNFGAGSITVDALGLDTIDGDPNHLMITGEGVIFVDYINGGWLIT